MNVLQNYRAAILLSFLILVPVLLIAQDKESPASEPLTIDEAVEIALQNNRDIAISAFDINVAESAANEVTGQFFPEVSFSGQYTRNIQKPVIFIGEGFPGGEGGGGTIETGYNNSYVGNLNIDLPIYSRELIKSRQSARKNVELSETAQQQTENAVVASVKRSYYSVLVSQQVIEFTQERLANAEDQFQDAKRLYEQGVSSRYDMLSAEVQLENIRPDLIEAENSLEQSVLEFKRLLGIVDADTVRLEGELAYEETSMANIADAEQALARNPELLAFDQQLELQEINIETQRAALFPVLSANGNYQVLSQDDTYNFSDYDWVNTSSVGLSIQVPIFAGNSNRERITQSQIELQQLEEERRAVEESLQTQYESARNNLRQVRRRVQALERNVEQAETAFDIARTSFEQGAATQLEVRDAELSYAESQLNYLEAVYDFHIALIDLQELQGDLYRYNRQ